MYVCMLLQQICNKSQSISEVNWFSLTVYVCMCVCVNPLHTCPSGSIKTHNTNKFTRHSSICFNILIYNCKFVFNTFTFCIPIFRVLLFASVFFSSIDQFTFYAGAHMAYCFSCFPLLFVPIDFTYLRFVNVLCFSIECLCIFSVWFASYVVFCVFVFFFFDLATVSICMPSFCSHFFIDVASYEQFSTRKCRFIGRIFYR